MDKQELYKTFISKLEEALNIEDFENIDFILESIYTFGFDDKTIMMIDDILQEATLFSEFKEEEYKTEALKIKEKLWKMKKKF